jgi:hypothetical protein
MHGRICGERHSGQALQRRKRAGRRFQVFDTARIGWAKTVKACHANIGSSQLAVLIRLLRTRCGSPKAVAEFGPLQFNGGGNVRFFTLALSELNLDEEIPLKLERGNFHRDVSSSGALATILGQRTVWGAER